MYFTIIFLFFILRCAAQDFTQCVGPDLDWYTQVVGETPCTTYQRLRQTCNTEYTLGVLDINTPPDICDDQVGDCCCNYASFVLSMLCLNCQQDVNSTNGIDAGAGAYDIYLDDQYSRNCPITNNTLTPTILDATCNKGIKILDNFPFWDTGDWFYTFSRESIETTFASNLSNSFQPCSPSLFEVATSSSQSLLATFATGVAVGASTSTPSSSEPSPVGLISSNSTLSSGSIAGIVIGAIALVALTCSLIFMLLRERRKSNVVLPFSPNMSNVAAAGSTSWAIDMNSSPPRSLHQYGQSVSGVSMSSQSRLVPDEYPNSPPGYNSGYNPYQY